jgi:hypothetical protein
LVFNNNQLITKRTHGMKIVHRGALPSAIKITQNNQKNLTLVSCSRKKEEKE